MAGSAGYVYMRGGGFGEEPPEDGSNLPALREAFLEALRSLEARLSVTPGPCSTLRVAPWQCPSSTPAPPRGAPDGSGAARHSQGEAQPLGAHTPPRVLELAAFLSEVADF